MGCKVSCGQYGSVFMNPDAKAPLQAATVNNVWATNGHHDRCLPAERCPQSWRLGGVIEGVIGDVAILGGGAEAEG